MYCTIRHLIKINIKIEEALYTFLITFYLCEKDLITLITITTNLQNHANECIQVSLLDAWYLLYFLRLAWHQAAGVAWQL